jgi:hypothetical protein
MPYKVCEKCKEQNGVRSFRCSKCKTPFGVKVEQKIAKFTRSKNCDLSEIKEGDLIKVSGGPVWITQKGEEVGLGEDGKFRVVSVTDRIIMAVGLEDRLPTVIYVGPEYQSKSGTFMRPHKVTKYK